MKTFALIFIHVACAVTLFLVACGGTKTSGANPKLKGEWKTADGETKLKITDNKFTEDNGQPVTEDYFVKGDTIFTSFEGNLPYTKFVIQKLGEKNLTLLYPDSVSVEFVK